MPDTERNNMGLRLLGALCAVYFLLLVYASLMPFDLEADWSRASVRLDRALRTWPFGDVVHTSRSDLLSNFLLYVPLGLLLAARWSPGRRAPRILAALGAILAASATSLLVEAAQLLSLARVASAQDWVMNSLGGVVGGVAGAAYGRRMWNALVRGAGRYLARRPIALVAAILLVLLAADAVFPFLPTLEVSQVKRNLKASHLSLLAGLAEHPWHHWMVRRVGVYAVLVLLLGGSSTRRSPQKWLRGAAATIALAAAMEIAKPFIVSRSANVASVVMSAAGAILGALGGWVMGGRLSARGKILLATGLLAAYIVYMEWEPFVVTCDAALMRGKIPSGAEWLPLYHYAMGARAEDVRLFARGVLLVAGLTYTIGLGRQGAVGGRRVRRMLTAAAWAGLLGLVLEGGQFLIPNRVPSITDVFSFALGGALGSWVVTAPLPGLRRQATCAEAS